MESNLNALVVEVKTNVEEVSQYAYRPDEQTLLYQEHIPNQSEMDINGFVNDTLFQHGIELLKAEELSHWQSVGLFYNILIVIEITINFLLLYLAIWLSWCQGFLSIHS